VVFLVGENSPLEARQLGADYWTAAGLIFLFFSVLISEPAAPLRMIRSVGGAVLARGRKRSAAIDQPLSARLEARSAFNPRELRCRRAETPLSGRLSPHSIYKSNPRPGREVSEYKRAAAFDIPESPNVSVTPSGFLLLILDGHRASSRPNFWTFPECVSRSRKSRHSGRINGEIKDLQRGIR